MYPPSRPRPTPDPKKVTGLGCLGCLGMLVLLVACGAVLNAVDPQPSPTSTDRAAATPAATASAATPTVTPAATPVPAPSADRAARLMCAYTVRAGALRRAGWTGKAETALDKAMDAASLSRHPEVAVLAGRTDGTFARRAGVWCRVNLPDVTASPVPERPTPAKTTRRPAPRPENRPENRPALRTVRPGAFCSPPGATGIYNGRIYTCKGPGQPRWRR
ncbi:hypothetical protein [Thermomonospora curvata]|uniref:Uncharacterized protein n=1 Tax=Thermomonospora curvata (strain ATCC 19995 / DSM 43183 / JCM 3096 / KCTC 9072 / NBRC 15933 / NCIMB 10081 / Henssen B9) TaxID=471852 RepID=D1AC84_THECD|nr:hypothetical protein [Thermomonospora curvata]ACY97350.1 hypothetical protein Tcur_1776 [Thermomonospora curvata DSM 43183]